MRADLDQAAIALDNAAVSVQHLPAPVNETLANQNGALRARGVELEEQVHKYCCVLKHNPKPVTKFRLKRSRST